MLFRSIYLTKTFNIKYSLQIFILNYLNISAVIDLKIFIKWSRVLCGLNTSYNKIKPLVQPTSPPLFCWIELWKKKLLSLTSHYSTSKKLRTTKFFTIFYYNCCAECDCEKKLWVYVLVFVNHSQPYQSFGKNIVK